jgi:hypothetical protein
MTSRLYVDRLEDTLLIPYQSVFALTDRTCPVKLHVTHSKDERGSESGSRSSVNLFIFNNMAERVGFESGLQRGFNNIENAAGIVKAMEDSGRQC